MSGQVFGHQHRVTYGECTLGNHVYYARYLDLLEEARGEFFRETGVTLQQWQDRDTLLPVIEIRVRYKTPARYDDVLTVELWIAFLRGVRLNFGCRILNEKGETVLEGETFHVCTSLRDKPRRFPPEMVALLQPFVAPGETAD